MKTGIALIGFMGTGKTAVGRVLAENLGREFIETDALIEEKAGRNVTKIFRDSGEIAFRELEIEVIKEVVGRKNSVIACGGGAVLNRINIDRLRRECIIVYLTASPGVILKRTAADNERPLLSAGDRALRIKELLRFRRPFYERAADITVDTSKLDIASVARMIVAKIEAYENQGK